jgi:hypothetical protein
MNMNPQPLSPEISYAQVLNALDANAELALDEIGFGEPNVNRVRHCVCPLHPGTPEHQVGVNHVFVSKHVACDVEDGKYDGLDVYRAANAIVDRPTAARQLLTALIVKHGRAPLYLEALDV